MIWFHVFGFAAVALGLLKLSRDPRVTRQFWIDAGFGLLNFTLFTFLGGMLTLLLWEPAVPRWHSLLLVGFIACWLLYGFVWLTRAGPRFKEPPRWIARRGSWLDGVLIGLTTSFGLSALLL